MSKKNSLVWVIFPLMAVIVTWPLAAHFRTSLSLGSESVPTVPYFNLWTMGWNVNRLFHGYADYWAAPIFYPNSGAFAFSDPQPLTGLLAALIWPLGAAAAYNFVLLLFLSLNGVAAFSLLRRRGLGLVPALCGGLLVEALPFLAHERGVLQLQPVFGVLWALNGWWQMADQPHRRWAIQIGLGTVVTFLTSEYYALFLALLLAVAVPFTPPRLWQDRKFWTAVWPGLLLVIILVTPVALPQSRAIQTNGFSRGESTITKSSAVLLDYLQPSSTLRESRWLRAQPHSTQALFPGIALLGLALAGLYIGLRQPAHRRWTLYLGAGTAVTLLLSLGFNLSLGGIRPYTLYYRFIPGFENLRSPFRLGHFVQISLALLAALALERLWYQRRLWGVGAALLVLVELMPAPARLTPLPPPIAVDALTPPLLFLPFPKSGATAAFAQTTGWMAATIVAPQPMINGYSGYFPHTQRQLRQLLADFPTTAGLATARTMGAKTVILPDEAITPGQQARLADLVANGNLVPHEITSGYQAFGLMGSQMNLVHAYDGEWVVEARMAGDEIEVRAYAAVPDRRIYLADASFAPFPWRVDVTDENGRLTQYDVAPAGAALLYHGSDWWLRIRLPRPETGGAFSIMVKSRETGRTMGRDSLTLLPE